MRKCRRTMKYLEATACGCWIVTDAWLSACVAAECRVDESGYEVAHMTSFRGGARALRMARTVSGSRLLTGRAVYLHSRQLDHFRPLLKYAGAALHDRFPSKDTLDPDVPRCVECKCGQLVVVDAAASARRTIPCQDCGKRILTSEATFRDVLVLVRADCDCVMKLRAQTGRAVVSFAWLVDSLSAGRLLAIKPYSFPRLTNIAT